MILPLRAIGGVAAALVLASCAGRVIPPSPHPQLPAPVPVIVAPPQPAATFADARAAGVERGPGFATLGVSTNAAQRALTAFRLSCATIERRVDPSGLTQPGDWAQPCRHAAVATDASAFFAERLEAVRVGNGQAFATGYYEPEIAGSRASAPGYAVPVYARPADLVDQPVFTCPPDWTVAPVAPPCTRVASRGRYVDGELSPYFERGQIMDGALADRVPVIAWAADPIEMFFLEVQGSGRLRLPDGQVMRIGFAGSNGQPYRGIGALLAERGLLPPGQRSMQGIMAWLRANPIEGDAVMRENRSYVFFRELTGAGPLGALGVPVSARASVAADPSFVPLGAPVWLDLDRAEADGLWVAQDTGGAIKGTNRFDTFWGAGDEARRIAGGMSGRGQAYILLPRASVALLIDGARP